jgi:type IV secretory pathway component VirB8
MKVKSWSKLDKTKYVCRFSIHQTLGDMKVFNKIAIVEIDYVPTELSDEDKDINPVISEIIRDTKSNENQGFQFMLKSALKSIRAAL